MNEFKGKRISIIGAARSGMASAIALKKLGAYPFLSENKPAAGFDDAEARLQQLGIECEFGGHTDRVYDCDLIVTSPGVTPTSTVLTSAIKKGIRIISEIELGFQLCRGKVIAITGSNGKTTTTSLVGEIFNHSHIKGIVGGNIGKPFVAMAKTLGENDWAILEISTFQLEWVEKFKPQVAVVLNITPDHLDRHGSMENYIALKLRIFGNQNGSNKAIVNGDDEILRDFKSLSETWQFSTRHEVDKGCFVQGDALILKYLDKEEKIIDIDEIGIKGPHNLANACAAAACAASAGIAPDAIAEGLRSFSGVEHRLENVGLIGGVSFINDSKATNVDAVYWALQSVSLPIVLIAGGRDKDADFSLLRKLISEKVKAIILIGEAADKMAASFDGITELRRAVSMDEAVRMAYAKAKPDGVVLLSPACASFDMFDNYEHRGRVFKQAVNNLLKEQG